MNKKHNPAFTLVEVLMALVILGMLMAAVAVAFDASVKNYQANEGIARNINTARQTLLRITNDIRTAQAVALSVNPNASQYTQLTGGINDLSISNLSLVSADGADVTYRFDQPTGTLFLVTNDDAADDDYVLCRNVTAMTFNRSVVAGSSPVAIRNVRIVMTLNDPDAETTQTLAAAAVVRRNL